MSANIQIKRLLAPAVILAVLNACSGGSGQQVETNILPPSDSENGFTYSGPSASTDDVTNFKINVWDNLTESDRCGSCHIEGEQTPMFVRQDDVNLAYAEANPLVDLASPAQSLLVTKVAEGHNCWESEASVCASIITGYIERWASASGAEPSEIDLEDPPVMVVGESKNFPDDDGALFSTTVHPLLVDYCSDCHSENSSTQQQPYFASDDIALAYSAAKSRMDLSNPASSRLVVRLRSEFHNCWDAGCPASAQAMEDKITEFSSGIEPVVIDPDVYAFSRAMTLPNGIVASSGGRVETAVVALYEFKTGEGTTAFDTSGVDPSLNLTFNGDDIEWVGSWGIRLNSGNAKGATAASVKLHDMIKATGEYSIEAWLVPDNVAQEGPARIVTYSGGPDIRNFTLGQTTYDYNFMTRSSVSDANGLPMLSTPSADEVLQATLQHVVVNFDPIDGRSTYVNGELVAQDATEQGNLNDWDPTYALSIGRELDNDYQWMGTMRLLAIHNRVLTPEQIFQNYEAGVGEKFFLLFGLEDLINVPQSYIVFEVQQFDDYAYLFNTPFYINLDTESELVPVTIQGMRLGINGREETVGQSFANIDVTVDSSNYDASEGTSLSDLGALLPLELGQDEDVFFLTFDSISASTGSAISSRPEVVVPVVPAADPAGEQSDIGVRTFDEVNATLSTLTTMPITSVSDTYSSVREAMPTVANVEGFLASHQSGVMQLAVAYCNALVNDTSKRSAYFGDFNFATSFEADLDPSESLKDEIIDPLLNAMLANSDEQSTRIETQPDPIISKMVLQDLIASLSVPDPDATVVSSTNTKTETIVIATCAAAFGSAAMLVQ